MITWDILVRSIPHRHDKLMSLLDALAFQMRPGVRVVLYRDNLETPAADKAQKLLEASTADYVSFIDDDDAVAADYIPRIRDALFRRPDYVGFMVACYQDGNVFARADHSLRYPNWVDGSDPLLRDISHLNPVRRELALLGRFAGDPAEGGGFEDRNWAGMLRRSGKVVTEEYIPAVMYHYRLASGDRFWTERKPADRMAPLPELPWLRQIGRDLAIVVPSRARPGNITRLWDAMKATCASGGTELVVGLDDDDRFAGEYPPGPRYVIRSGLRQVVGWMNELAVPEASRFAFVGHFGDDVVPLTSGWDIEVMDALAAEPFAFTNDLYDRPPGSLVSHVFARSDVVRTLGFLGSPAFRHMYVDVAWTAWGRRAGIAYLHDVVLEHRHFSNGKAPDDDSYRASTALIPQDLDAWHRYCAGGALNADLAAIASATGRPYRPYSPEQVAALNLELNIR